MSGRHDDLSEESYAAAITALNAIHYADEVSFYARPHLRGCERRLSAALKAPQRVLDVGCGAGRVLGALPEIIQAAGVDVNWVAVAAAKKTGNTRNALNA